MAFLKLCRILLQNIILLIHDKKSLSNTGLFNSYQLWWKCFLKFKKENSEKRKRNKCEEKSSKLNSNSRNETIAIWVNLILSVFKVVMIKKYIYMDETQSWPTRNFKLSKVNQIQTIKPNICNKDCEKVTRLLF